MKNKVKLKLIDNYIELHKVIFECTQSIINCKDYQYLINLTNLNKNTLKLKKDYEDFFKENNMMNDSLILLKMQLESSLSNPIFRENHKPFSYDFLLNKTKLIEKILKSN